MELVPRLPKEDLDEALKIVCVAAILESLKKVEQVKPRKTSVQSVRKSLWLAVTILQEVFSVCINTERDVLLTRSNLCPLRCLEEDGTGFSPNGILCFS